MPTPWGSRPPSFGHESANALAIEDRAMTLCRLRDLRDFLRRLCKTRSLLYPDVWPYVADATTPEGTAHARAGLASLPIKWTHITQHEICSQLIKRVIPSGPQSCSWAEFVSGGQPHKRHFFCSHNWSEPFRDFMAAIEHHARENAVVPDQSYWICVYANNQWLVELGDMLQNSPFYGALNNAATTLVMLDKAADILSRLWCVYEMNATICLQQEIQFWTPLGRVGSSLVSSGPVIQALGNISTARAAASNKCDERQIRNYIAGVPEMTGIEVLDGGRKVLQPALPRPVYEQELVTKHRHRFDELDAAIKGATQSLLQPEACCMLKKRRTPLHASLCAVRLEQLRTFAQHVQGKLANEENKYLDRNSERLRWEQLTMHDLRFHFIEPMTREHRCSFVEIVADGPQQPEFYVTQAWSTSFKHTMSALEWHAEARQLPGTAAYWIDLFAFSQHADSEGLKEVNELCIDEAPPARALAKARGLVAIMDDCASLLGRGWCVYDMWRAQEEKKMVDLSTATGCLATSRPFADCLWEYGDFGVRAARSLFSVVMQDCRTTRPADRRRVLNRIALGKDDGECEPPSEHPAYDKFNKRVRNLAVGPCLRQNAWDDHKSWRKFDDARVPINAPGMRGINGETPLHIAAAAGHCGFVLELLTRSADANAQDFEGETPLHYAALAGQAGTAELLLRVGADPNIESFWCETALEVARQRPTYFLGVDASAVEKCLASATSACGTVRTSSIGCSSIGCGNVKTEVRLEQEVAPASCCATWPRLANLIYKL